MFLLFTEIPKLREENVMLLCEVPEWCCVCLSSLKFLNEENVF